MQAITTWGFSCTKESQESSQPSVGQAMLLHHKSFSDFHFLIFRVDFKKVNMPPPPMAKSARKKVISRLWRLRGRG
jgi:hypothetical protein